MEIKIVKTSIKNIWKPDLIPSLLELVSIVHTVVLHQYSFCKFIFLKELEKDPQFPFDEYLELNFFREVFLALLRNYNPDKRRKAHKTDLFKTMINSYRLEYFADACYEPVELRNAHQIATYESEKVLTTYLNNIKQNFGDRFRMLLNLLFRRKERIEGKEKELRSQKKSEDEIKLAVKKIVSEITTAKLAVIRKRFEDIPEELHTKDAIDSINIVLNTYRKHTFQKDSIYYDVEATPVKHALAFYYVSILVERLQQRKKGISCFPIRTSMIPSHMKIDQAIVKSNILKNKARNLDKMQLWGSVLDLEKEVFKPKSNLSFHGLIYTDGVSASILKQSEESKARGRGGGNGSRSRKKDNTKNEFDYIEDMTQEQLVELSGKCVLIDPGRRDLLFCLHENSTTKKKMTFRYTSNDLAVATRSRKFSQMRAELKPKNVQESEAQLSKHTSTTSSLTNFRNFMQQRGKVYNVLQEYYSENRPKNERSSETIPFRKLKLSSYFNREKADKRLAQALRTKFGPDAVLIIGNWSAPHVKYQEPIRGKGMRRMLKRHGFKVFLIDEFRTSTMCPSCLDGELKTFKNVVNPRKKQRVKRPIIKCHGLIRCSNKKCLRKDETKRRMFNRDLAATLNFRHILNNLRSNNKRPVRFSRTTYGTKRKATD